MNGCEGFMTAADRRLLVGTEQLYGGPSGDNAEIIVDGSMKTIEQAGSLFSGVYSLSQGKLDVLISNMDDTSHKVTLPGNIGGLKADNLRPQHRFTLSARFLRIILPLRATSAATVRWPS